jgi:hypothetical protein
MAEKKKNLGGRPKGILTKEAVPLPKGQKAFPGRERDRYGRFLPGPKWTGKEGKPREHEPTPEDFEQIERLAAAGHGIVSVRKHLGIHQNTWKRWTEEHPETLEAYRRGLAAEEVHLVTELRRIVTEKDNPIPGIFLLKTRHGYQEGQQQGPDNRVQIAVTLPAPLKPEQYKQLIEVEKPGLPEPKGNDDE